MAIKGKSRNRGARTVARGPKPAYVPVRQPLLQRRGFWIGVAVVLGIAAVAGLIYGFARQRTQDRQAAALEAMADAAREYRTQLDPILAPVGRASPPTFLAFPELTTALDGLESEGDAEEISTTLEEIRGEARTASEALASLDASAIVRDRGLDQDFILRILGSKEDLASGIRIYGEAAALGELAAGAAEADVGDLIERARALAALGAEVVGRGYSAYVEAQSQAGVFEPTFPAPTGPLAGLTGLTAPTGPTAAVTGPTAATGSTTAATGSTGTS